MSFYEQLASRFPELKKDLRIAHINQTPVEYVKQKFQAALFMSIGMGIFAFFVLSKMGIGIIMIVVTIIIFFFAFFSLFMRQVQVVIRRREKDIDREVLFAGRFLLIKLNTGEPLINALVEASKSYGVANKYFKEIVREIELGTPLEQALEMESYYTPSQKFRKILFQITNALKIGIDVSNFLSSILDEIAEEQLIEIKRYGKKLNSMTLFYMLIAIVVPSLGVTIFIVVASLVSLAMPLGAFMIIVFFLALVQLIFISAFKMIRPDVNI
ncbi:MAG: type II secretion system F family protein [Nanoarchaeota archaeon]|nr:type II secretion system F family protein [Nanoarchaeota archaeon]